MFARNEDDKTPDQMLPPKEKSETVRLVTRNVQLDCFSLFL